MINSRLLFIINELKIYKLYVGLEMPLNRRRFLTTCISTACAPAIIKSDNLMSLWIPNQQDFDEYDPIVRSIFDTVLVDFTVLYTVSEEGLILPILEV